MRMPAALLLVQQPPARPPAQAGVLSCQTSWRPQSVEKQTASAEPTRPSPPAGVAFTAPRRRRRGSRGDRCRSRRAGSRTPLRSAGVAPNASLLWPQFCGARCPDRGTRRRRRPPDRRRRKLSGRGGTQALTPGGLAVAVDLPGASRAGRPAEQDRGGEHGRRCGS